MTALTRCTSDTAFRLAKDTHDASFRSCGRRVPGGTSATARGAAMSDI